MSIKSAPTYYYYITQDCDPFFDVIWEKKLKTLTRDLSWIDALNAQGEAFSKDLSSEDFPTYHHWPLDWKMALQACSNEAHKAKTEYLKGSQKHEIDRDTLYINDETEEVFFSTNSYGYGDIRKMMVQDDRFDSVLFDSVLTAAYAYLNDYREWKEEHGANWEALNILSGAEPCNTDSLVGTTQECDGCGAYTLIAKEDNNQNCFCKNCTS